MAGVAGTLAAAIGDFDDCTVDACSAASTAGRCAGCGCWGAGELVALVRVPLGARVLSAAATPGGGGSGAIPTPFLSLAAAAAAAEAYFNGSPGVRVGIGAGFIELDEGPETPGNGVCRVAKAGNGDFI